ncbi:unnamed protein product [Paramecium octaurelia]|uniref:Uncharacterized protein n=1 Tax=Paramecium octaurelia TaxID=43137 RepID=A0A8S1STP9_PAROT|nr:unnamed protein product [Paramecium octaurelia]
MQENGVDGNIVNFFFYNKDLINHQKGSECSIRFQNVRIIGLDEIDWRKMRYIIVIHSCDEFLIRSYG